MRRYCLPEGTACTFTPFGNIFGQSSGLTDGSTMQSPPLCECGMRCSVASNTATSYSAGYIFSLCFIGLVDDAYTSLYTDLPVGWGGHLLVGCQLQGVDDTQDLTVGENHTTLDDGYNTVPIKIGLARMPPLIQGLASHWYSLKVPPSAGWVEERQLQPLIWSYDEDL